MIATDQSQNITLRERDLGNGLNKSNYSAMPSKSL